MRTETGRHALPPPAEISPLMGDYAAWLKASPNTAEIAFQARLRLVDIHPFNDGNDAWTKLWPTT